ncbi:hypothetical protein B9Z55_003269 [Caenorhabditis nigoni]|uniref:Uncharacterized protein n=1 Tax=Caenorhabditis nigoni TaxID=1611254 RepID=A0A2G5VPN2_9PELO|nr:hypothetical protein B9Z55_003269 [Caenorhabditis nigoni]
MAVSRLPAPCPCDVKGIDDTNIVKYAGSSRGYEEVVAYPISTPTIIQNDCVVKMNCPKESKLTLIHTNALFPSVVGFQCDRNRKIWKYSNAFELKGLYGTCQDTEAPKRPVCPCLHTEVIESNRGTFENQYTDFHDVYDVFPTPSQQPIAFDGNGICYFAKSCPYGSISVLTDSAIYTGRNLYAKCDMASKKWNLNVYNLAYAPEIQGISNFDYTSYPTNFSCPEFQLLHGSGNIKISGVSEFQDTEAPVVDSLKSYPPSPGACYKTLSCTGNYRDLYYYKHGDDNAYFIAHLPYVNSTEQLYASIAYHPVKKQYVVNGKAENVRAFTCGSQETQ